MKRFNIIFALVLVFFAGTGRASTTTPLFSDEEYRVGKGDIETNISVQPLIIRGSGGDEELLSMNLGANYFMTDIFAPGLEFDIEAGGDFLFRLLPNIKFYYPTNSRILPYLQAGFGYERAVGDSFAAFAIGPGVNYLLSNSVALGIQFRYDIGAGSETLHTVSFPIQFAIYFKY